jgi:hypothetical protein
MEYFDLFIGRKLSSVRNNPMEEKMVPDTILKILKRLVIILRPTVYVLAMVGHCYSVPDNGSGFIHHC